MIKKSQPLILLAVMFLVSANIQAAEHTIMAQATNFSPLILFVQPGDTVQFTNMSPLHDSVSIQGLVPDEAQGWSFAKGENGTLKLDKEGIYIYKCNPHYAVGMSGAIIVGEATNLGQVKANATGRSKGVVIKVARALAKKTLAKK